MALTSAVPSSAPSQHRLKVIALISGGKDSLYSLLHCLANGHDVVALGNLYPPQAPPLQDAGDVASAAEPQQAEDMDSYMYQTVGHSVLPLYAAALGIPLYRQEIRGGAHNTNIAYSHCAPQDVEKGDADGASSDEDETESLTRLLRTILSPENHPEANAVASGAILSTYQRTRIESVAMRLGLVPLAFLWQYDVLPPPTVPPPSETTTAASHTPKHSSRPQKAAALRRAPPEQLLHDMAAAGLDARIVKVASGGLDERFLWRDVAHPSTVGMLTRAAARFGAAGRGSVLGEGGEFETLVLAGPAGVWKGRIEVGAFESEGEAGEQQGQGWEVVRGGGGSAAVAVLRAKLVVKDTAAADGECGGDVKTESLARVRIPQLLDPEFEDLLSRLAEVGVESPRASSHSMQPPPQRTRTRSKVDDMPLERLPPQSIHHVARTLYISNLASSPHQSVGEQTAAVLATLRHELNAHGLTTQHLTHTTILLRRMANFAQVNALYGDIFTAPNPPSRATVAVGNVLPTGVDLMLHAVADHCDVLRERRGLHVQSRSYWAPANIGPYSQTICVPLSTRDEEMGVVDGDNNDQDDSRDSAGAQLITVAGQIPLVPASMELADAADFAKGAVLACQHLWRVGRAMGTGWWVSGVVFVTAENDTEAVERAKLAGRIWTGMHERGIDEDEELDDDEDEDFDIAERSLRRGWDSMSASTAAGEIAPPLPDWDIIRSKDEAKAETCPPGFVVQVAELPRGAEVEWSSFGLGREASIHICQEGLADGEEQKVTLDVCHSNGTKQAFACGVARNAEQLGVLVHYLEAASHEVFFELYTSGAVPQWLQKANNIAVVPSLRVWSFDGDELFAGVRCRFSMQ